MPLARAAARSASGMVASRHSVLHLLQRVQAVDAQQRRIGVEQLLAAHHGHALVRVLGEPQEALARLPRGLGRAAARRMQQREADGQAQQRAASASGARPPPRRTRRPGTGSATAATSSSAGQTLGAARRPQPERPRPARRAGCSAAGTAQRGGRAQRQQRQAGQQQHGRADAPLRVASTAGRPGGRRPPRAGRRRPSRRPPARPGPASSAPAAARSSAGTPAAAPACSRNARPTMRRKACERSRRQASSSAAPNARLMATLAMKTRVGHGAARQRRPAGSSCAARSAIISVGELVLPLVMVGMTLASATRRPAHAVHAQPRVDHRQRVARPAPSSRCRPGGRWWCRCRRPGARARRRSGTARRA